MQSREDPAPVPTASGLPTGGYRLAHRPVMALAFGVALTRATGRQASSSGLPLPTHRNDPHDFREAVAGVKNLYAGATFLRMKWFCLRGDRGH
jgi:hypothetical protein